MKRHRDSQESATSSGFSAHTGQSPSKRAFDIDTCIQADFRGSLRRLKQHQTISAMIDDDDAAVLLRGAISLATEHRLRSDIDPAYQKVDNIKIILRRNHVAEKLFDAVRGTGSWKDLMMLDDLKQPDASSSLSEADNNSQWEATQRSWRTPFLGNHHKLLLQILNNMDVSRLSAPAYSNFTSIIQSSGTGKSRTIREMARLVLSIPITLREEKESGFPVGNTSLLNFFTEELSSVSMEEHIRFFLAYLFESVEKEVNVIRASGPGSLPENWQKHLENDNQLQKMFTGVLSRAEAKQIIQVETDSKGLTEGQNALEDAATRLINCLEQEQSVPNQRIRLVISIDEAHHLTNPQPGRKLTPYQALTRTLNDLAPHAIFTIFLSTNSRLARLAPSKRLFHSERVVKAEVDPIQTPITEMPFDVWHIPGSEGIIAENTKTMDDVCKYEFMVRFGRPLFWTRWDSGDAVVRNHIVEYAVSKLTNQANWDRSNRDDVHAVLAAIGTRIVFDFDTTRASAIEMETRLVEGHMRIAYLIPRHREYMRTGASSEPILGEAAARVMNSGPKTPDYWPQFLADRMNEGVISKGQGGEMVMQLLLIAAMDTAHRRKAQDSVPKYSDAVLVPDFMVSLLGDAHAKKILDSKPRDARPGAQTMREAFGNGQIRFTSFVRTNDYTPVTDDFMWACISRCQAIQCWRNQMLVDFIIPTLLYDTLLGRYVVTAIFIQVKDTVIEKHPFIDIGQFPIPFFSEPTPDKTKGVDRKFISKANCRPYIVMTANLGVQKPRSAVPAYLHSFGKARPPKGTTFPAAGGVTPPGSPGAPQPVSPTKVDPVDNAHQANTRAKSDEHPCYSFEVTGCSSEVYAVIGKDGKHTWRRLLGAPDLLDEHPRTTNEAILAMLQLKPLWSANLHSMDWVSPGMPDRLRRQRNPEAEDAKTESQSENLLGRDFVGGVDSEGYPILQEGVVTA